MRVLVYHSYGIGDMIMFTPVLEELKKKYEDLSIDFVITMEQKISSKVIESFSKTNKIYYINSKDRKEQIVLAYKLRKKYDVFLNTSGSISLTCEIFSLILNSKINLIELRRGRKSVLKYISNYMKKKYILTDHNINIHRVIGNLELVKRGLNIEWNNPKTFYYLEEKNIDYSEKWSKKLKYNITFGIHPGCNKKFSEKRWPAENYLKLIQKLTKKEMNIIIFIGPDDIEIEEVLKEKVNADNLYFCKEKDLSNVAALISKCDYFFNSDSGLGHIAGCFNSKKIFTVIGPANPLQTRVYNDNVTIIRIKNEDEEYYKQKDNNGILKCLSDLSVEYVYSQIISELSN